MEQVLREKIMIGRRVLKNEEQDIHKLGIDMDFGDAPFRNWSFFEFAPTLDS